MKRMLIFFLVSLPFISFAQSNWHPYGGVHVSMDAEGVYVGPSIQVGTDYSFSRHLYNKQQNYAYTSYYTFSSYLHYFSGKDREEFNDGTHADNIYRTLTLAILVQTPSYPQTKMRGFAAGGLAFQRIAGLYKTATYEEHSRNLLTTFAFRGGYIFPVAKKCLTIEINATGPYFSKKGPAPTYDQTTLILTQLSLGMRMIL